MICLCSKTYICFGEDDFKVSCKGIQKKRNLENLTKQAYMNVLNTQKAGEGINKGFVAKNGQIYSYTQTRSGLS